MNIFKADSQAVFGLPFKYDGTVDNNNRIYNDVFMDLTNTQQPNTKFWPFRLTVGVPQMVENRLKKTIIRMGDELSKNADADPKATLETIKKDMQENGENLEKGLRTFYFG